TVATVAGPAHGTLVLNGDGSFTYTPDNRYSGPDSFSYQINDHASANNLSNVAIVSLTVISTNEAPVANGDVFATDLNTPLTVAGPGVLGNDSDPDSDSLTAQLVSTVAHGSLVFNADGSFTYTPLSSFTGTDRFVYRADDGQSLNNLSNPATVTL